MTAHTAGSPEVSVDSTQSTLDSPVENCATSKPGDTDKMATSMQSGEALKINGTQGSGSPTTARGMEPDTSSMSTATDSVAVAAVMTAAAAAAAGGSSGKDAEVKDIKEVAKVCKAYTMKYDTCTQVSLRVS
jgi:hypothetical protein